jgi:hypothetical protein
MVWGDTVVHLLLHISIKLVLCGEWLQIAFSIGEALWVVEAGCLSLEASLVNAIYI